MDLTPEQQYSLAPNLSLADKNTQRYPNQFFDLSQQYMPPTVKELFRWCTFYYYNSSLIGPAVRKMSRYPITDLIIEDSRDSVREMWEKILNDNLKVKTRLMGINLDKKVYGNSFASLHLPFTRILKCKECGYAAPIRQWDWRFVDYDFHGNCGRCKNSGKTDVKDVPYKDVKKVRIIRWSPENIDIKYNEYTGNYTYLYTPPRKIRYAVSTGDKDIIEDMPLIVLQAIKDNKKIKMNQDNFVHFKNPTLAEQDQGWGKPDIINVLKDLFYFYTLRRAQEAIALEHIVPLDIIYPMPNAQMDPYMHSDLASWRSEVQRIITRHRRDPNFKGVIPVPVGYGRIGGDGKALMLTPELNYLTQTVVGGIGIPNEFVFGGLNWCLKPDSYLFCSRGLVTLKEICPEDVGVSVPEDELLVDTRDGRQRVALLHRTETKPQVSVETKMGLSLTGSPIHKVLVLGEDMSMGWKTLQEVRVGDYVAVSRESDIWGTKELPKELCRLLGYLVSDGSCSEKEMGFSNTDPEVIEDFVHCFSSVFGSCPSVEWRDAEDIPGHYGSKRIGSVRSSRKDVLSSLEAWDMFHYSSSKKVPAVIRMSTKACVFEFIRALFEGDGCCPVREVKQSILYASISEKLLEEVQLLLLNAGIVSYLYPKYENMVPTLHISSVYASRYMEEVGFVSSSKNNAYNESITRHAHRCEAQKYPHLLKNLKELKERFCGISAWTKDEDFPELSQDMYTTKDVATLIKRDYTRVNQLIKEGKLEATKEVRADGKYPSHLISKESLQRFFETVGLRKRAAVGQTTWEINTNNIDKVNWDTVKELAPDLYDRVNALKKANFIWDKVTEKNESLDEIEMCDLTVFETHSYVANGFISHNTGSSVSLRTLENDFIQDRTDLLDFIHWIKDKLRSWLSLPNPENMYFADFRMADDVQRNQQLIGLNAQGKVSNQTMLTELGYDYEQEIRRLVEEAHIQNFISEVLTKGQAKSQGEAQLIGFNFQNRINELASQAQMAAQKKMESAFGHDNTGQIQALVQKLLSMPPQQAEVALAELKQQVPEAAAAVETAYRQVMEAHEEQQSMQMQQQMEMQAQQDQAMQDHQMNLQMTADQAALQQEIAANDPSMQPAAEADKAKRKAANTTTDKPKTAPNPEQKPPRRQGGV